MNTILKLTDYNKIIKKKLLDVFSKNNIKGTIYIVEYGNSNDNISYINSIKKNCDYFGFNCVVSNFSHSNIDNSILYNFYSKIEDDHNTLGIINMFDENASPEFKRMANNLITTNLDIDRQSDESRCDMIINNRVYPCTVEAIMYVIQNVLKIKKFDYTNVLILGRSNIIGKPLANALLNKNATVTVAHSKSVYNINNYDMVIAATGNPLKFTILNPFTVLIDAGINFKDGKICGDIDLSNSTFSSATPVPGGIGAITNIMLFNNICKLKDIEGI